MSNQSNEMVVLVDVNDNEIGLAEKMAAHENGWLHRAFSVFIFNSKGQLLLQKRAKEKYHSPSLWTNTCCSHPRTSETVEVAATRRLKEEMGLSCPTSRIFAFVYKAELENGLIEHEYDHVFVGFTDESPILNPHEVDDFLYIERSELNDQLVSSPEKFTSWFKICWPTVEEHLLKLEKK